jgi:hypothetical protein
LVVSTVRGPGAMSVSRAKSPGTLYSFPFLVGLALTAGDNLDVEINGPSINNEHDEPPRARGTR